MKYIAILLCVLCALGAMPACAEAENEAAVKAELAGIDLSTLGYEALLQLEQETRLELMSRPEGCAFELSENAYIVGKDIPEGRYRFGFGGERTVYNSTNHMGWLVLYDTYENYKSGYSYNSRQGRGDLVVLTDADSAEFDLNTGNVLIVRVGPVAAEKIGYIAPTEAYSPPSGTLVPAGWYTVGEDIPAGSYTAYYRGGSTVLLRTYESKVAYDNDRYTYLSRATVDKDNTQATLRLENGQVLDVYDGSVIMKKFESFTFD